MEEFWLQLDACKLNKLKFLKLSLEKIQSRSEEILHKIEKDGISGYYSTNEDLLRLARDAWCASFALGELKRIETELKRQIRKNKKLN
tara:strand:- start:488 stop:751 length:264 start_codon:yes stop_codon:yes gene_type:complete